MAAIPTTGASGPGSREARRRRIAERGSDRLALITGRIQSLPSDPYQLTSPPDHAPPPADSHQDEDIASDSTVMNQVSGQETSQQSVLDETVEPLLPDRDGSGRIEPTAESLPGLKGEFSQASSSMESRPMDGQQEKLNHHSSITTKQICSAVADSEDVRICCSVAAALLVILAYIGFPGLGGNAARSIMLFRPVYLLWLTNISIVLARLILGKHGARLRARQTHSAPTIGGNDLFDQLGKALELGLLLQAIFGALLMDFSIYAVVLTCGFSLVGGVSR